MWLKGFLITGFIFSLLFVLDWIFIQPLQALKMNLSQNLLNNKSNLNDQGMIKQELSALLLTYKNSKVLIEEKSARIANQEQLPLLIEVIYKKAEATGIRIEHFRPKQVKKFHFMLMQSFDLTVFGSWPSLFHFFEVIGEMKGLMTFDDFLLKKREFSEGQLNIYLKIQGKIYQKLYKQGETGDSNSAASMVLKSFLIPIETVIRKKRVRFSSDSLQSLAFVGMMHSEFKTWVLIKLPAGDIVPVYSGELIGQESAEVIGIMATFVRLKLKNGQLVTIHF